MNGPALLAWSVLVVGALVVSWAIPKARQERQRSRCHRGRHEWAYTGEARVTPSARRCRVCGMEIARNLTVDRPPMPMIRTVESERPEADVRVLGVWGEPRVDRFTVRQMERRHG